MTCRVFLVGEGPTDIGDLVELPGYRGGGEGFLQPILRQMVAGGVDLDFFDGRKLTELKRLTRRDAPHHLQTRKAAQALALASVLGADALVFACDLDKSHGAAKAVERRRRLREIRRSIEAGFAHARETDPEAARVLTAAAVPARMIEAWRDQITHAEIGERARPHVLERACPESFVPFARDVTSALARCRATRAA